MVRLALKSVSKLLLRRLENSILLEYLQQKDNPECCKRVLSKTVSEQIESLENFEISAIPRDTKNEVCPQGAYTTQNFIF